jgi:hypothetical protein
MISGKKQLYPQLRLRPSMKAMGLCLFLFVAGAARGQTLADGFYRLSGDESARSVLSQGGKRLLLGRTQELAIERNEIFSEDNANSQFWVTVAVPYDPNLNASSLVLVVANRGYPSAGGGSSPGISQIDFRVSGASSALDVSRYLNTPIVYRRHPAHQLLVSFAPTKERFQIGDEVKVELRITNIGANTIAFLQGGQYRGSRDNQYAFSARLLGWQIRDIGTSSHHGGIGVKRTLAPDEVFEAEISLGKWFSFDEVGRYEVHGSYYLSFLDPDGESFRPIWTDYVSSDFVVNIDEQQTESGRRQ